MLALVGQIYDAALDPALWGGVLDAVAKFIDVARATLILEDASDPMRSILYSSLCEPDSAAAYLESFILVSPSYLAPPGRQHPAEVIVAREAGMSLDCKAKTPFVCDFLRKRNLIDSAVAALGRPASTVAVLSLQRSVERGFADVDLRDKLELLVPHLERAAAIGLTIDRRTANADSLADTLDKVAAGVFLLGDAGEVVHANAAARQLMTQGRVFRHVDGRLTPVDRAARVALARGLAAARAGSDDTSAAGCTMSLGEGEPTLLGTLLTLRAASRADGVHHRAVALLSVRPAAMETTPAAASFAQRYRLTPRELTVLVAIVEQGGIHETAASLGLTDGTVKGYIKSIFQKTGARRQADLVRMIAGFASPFRAADGARTPAAPRSASSSSRSGGDGFAPYC